MWEWVVARWNRPPARDRVLAALEGIDTPEKALPGRVIRERAGVARGTIYIILERLVEEGLLAVRFEYDPSTELPRGYWWLAKRGARDRIPDSTSGVPVPSPAW